MRKTVAIVAILALSVLIGLSWTGIEKAVTKQTHPFKYREIVETYSAQYGVPQEILYAVIRTESGFVPDAVSPSGAVGLMQLLPSTYEWLCTKTGEEYNLSTLYDPDVNIRYGAYLLSYFYAKFGVWETVYAAYNAGDSRVREWLEDPRYGLDGRLIEIPYEETRNYVAKVSDNAAAYAQILQDENRKNEG